MGMIAIEDEGAVLAKAKSAVARVLASLVGECNELGW